MNRYQKNLIASSQHLSGLFREILSNSATYLRLSPSFSLENNFSLVDLKYSPKFMTTKSFPSSSVKIFNSHHRWNIQHYAYNRNQIVARLKL